MSEENQHDNKHIIINAEEEPTATKEEEALELHYQLRPPITWNTIWADKPLDQVFLDLADMSKLKDKKGNKGYAWTHDVSLD